MARTPDRTPGVLDEEGIQLESTAAATQAGEVRYTGTRFSLYDSAGEYDPRSGGGGITESQHEGLDRLTHAINETSFDEPSYTGNRVDSIVTWTSAAKTLKIREEQFTYTGNKVTQIVTIQYDGAGAEVERNTEVLAYSGNQLTSITRTHA